MKIELAKNHIYQYQSLSGPVSRHSEFKPEKVYLTILAIDNNIAKCKVSLIIEQPQDAKIGAFRRNKIVYLPISHLVEPDLYPKYANNPRKWMHLSSQPVLDSAMEIMSEISPTMHSEIVTAATVDKRDLKVGQKWQSQNNTLTLDKAWGDSFIVKDKFGDYQRYTRQELSDKLSGQNYRLLKTFDTPALMKAVKVLLTPYMGAWALALLMKAIPGLLTKNN